ncbi:MAG: AEC family transporter [Oscillospiraceae bacterium]|nr:hypothetical protein [Oscillospiraceae bacterium]MBQ6847109.1 AEC family transporter [Oscillospiraceae bacterium]MBQ7120232.1 AEC family transporter [Oscillospiraceae bacterium]
MGEITSTTINQLILMFFFMAIGFIFKRKRILDAYSSGTISRLLVNLFLPAMVIRSFSDNFKADVLADKAMLLLFSCIILLITGVMSIFLAKLFAREKNENGERVINKNTQGIYIYSFTIPNLGYMGYPLVQAVFGDSALTDAMIYCMPYNVYIYTLGMYFLTEHKTITFKSMITPPFLATFVGMALGLIDFEMPKVITRILTTAESCVSPCAMILTGAVFARMDMTSVFRDWRPYAASAIRLLIIPLAFLGLFKVVGIPEGWVLPCVAILAMPLGVNSIVFPEAYGGDAESGAKVCFMAAILAIFTIPVVFALL